jgi:predicted nucleic acid-binding protein
MKRVVVVDTSLALKWIYDEKDSPIALSLLAEWTGKKMKIKVPSLLAYEITNSLYQQVRNGKSTFDSARQNLMDILPKGMRFVFLPDFSLNIRALELTHHFGLPATYDAHYLALAERENCDLWTADMRMWRAVKDQLPWVHLLSDYSPTP